MRSRCLVIVACAVCASCSNDTLTQENARLTAELLQCKTESQELQRSVNDLKKRLALAIADQQPRSSGGRDESVARQASGNNVKQGTIEQDEVIRTVDQSKGAIQACYNRALKRNSGLHAQAVTVTARFTVEPNGIPREVSVNPNYDEELTDCIHQAIEQLRFPEFEGQAVLVETPLRLTPTS